MTDAQATARRTYREDLTGQVFGRLTVVSESPKRRYPSNATARRWACRCECGADTVVSQRDLKSGHTRSCGCLRRESIRRAHTHGHSRRKSRSATYESWAGMKQRCENPNDSNYAHYGGRGITICPAWRDSFAVFLADMGECPPKMSIDRIDNNGPYCPFNCRWATRLQQGANKRTNRHITFRGETLTVSQWARKMGLPPVIVQARIFKLGWPIERSLTEPVHRKA